MTASRLRPKNLYKWNVFVISNVIYYSYYKSTKNNLWVNFSYFCMNTRSQLFNLKAYKINKQHNWELYQMWLTGPTRKLLTTSKSEQYVRTFYWLVIFLVQRIIQFNVNLYKFYYSINHIFLSWSNFPNHLIL